MSSAGLCPLTRPPSERHSVWDLRVREVEDRLRALYDEEDYPSWDEQLRGLVEDVRGLLSGQDVSRLRKDQGLRELVQERMQSVKVVLDTLVEDAPVMQIVLRE